MTMEQGVGACQQRFKDAISEYLGGGVYVSLFWKGRVALYAILKALGVDEGDEVIVPGFTCVVVPNAVMYTGARPLYADIDPRTYTITRETVEPLVTDKTRVIVAQNTFGLSADIDPILRLGEERGIEIIDDCAHGLGGTYKGRKNGVTSDIAFFSTQWNKPISTGLGGFTVTRNERFGRRLRELELQAEMPSAREVQMLRLLNMARSKLVGRRSYWLMVGLYRWLGDRGVVVGSSESIEVKAPGRPDGYFKGMSAFQARAGLRALSRLDEDNRSRLAKAARYDMIVGRAGVAAPYRPAYAEHCFLKYPVRVPNRLDMMREARKAGIRLGDWFVSPLHPVMGDLSAWDFVKGGCPVSEAVSGDIVNLPTDPDVGEKEVETIGKFVLARGGR